MAVQALKSTETTDGYRSNPNHDHGKVRTQFFDVPATTVAGDATSTVDLCNLPPGRVRVIPELSRITNSAFGAARTLSIGHTAYPSRDPAAADPEPANPTAFAAALDVSAANNGVALSNVLKYDIYSKAGVLVQATVNVDTIPVGATLSGFIAYVYE